MTFFIQPHISTIEWFVTKYPGSPNETKLLVLKGFCYTYQDGEKDLKEKQDALDECEGGVGIIEYEWVKDECGGYWRAKGALASKSTMTGNATSAWESTNTGANVKTQYINNRQH